MTDDAFEASYAVAGRDFTAAGRASTAIKDTLKRLGVAATIVRRVAIAAYEAEMNVVMYADRGTIRLVVSPDTVVVLVEDAGPGIADVELAMQEGWSTATPEMREMGFGAGMGLPNIRRSADELRIDSRVGEGTSLEIRVVQASA